MRCLFLVVLIALGGCAARPTIVSSSEKMVVIETNYVAAAIEKAEGECTKFGKRARLYRSENEYHRYFDCL